MNPFPGAEGIPEHLIPNVPGAMPEARGAGDAMAGLSPFKEALDLDQIFANLVLDRPLKLYIPNKERYPEYEFRIINSIPQEIADAHNKGFRQVTDPELSKLFVDLVAGTNEEGKAYRPLLVARPKKVGDHIRKQNRMKLASLYAGMDPKNREFQSGYAKNAKEVSEANFSGPSWRIRV